MNASTRCRCRDTGGSGFSTQTELEAQLKQRIQQRMGEATKVLFEMGDVTWKRSKDGSGLDVERLLKEQPELLNSFPLVKPGSRRFLVNV